MTGKGDGAHRNGNALFAQQWQRKAEKEKRRQGKVWQGLHSGGKGKRGSERNGCDMQRFAMAQRWVTQRSGGDDSYDLQRRSVG